VGTLRVVSMLNTVADSSSCKTLMSVMQRMVPRFPAPVDCDQEQSTDETNESITMPTTIRAAVRIFPETKLLTNDYQEIKVAIEVEGVLHNREALPDTTVDIIFVVDNGWVSELLALSVN
jgi:transposase-like protein